MITQRLFCKKKLLNQFNIFKSNKISFYCLQCGSPMESHRPVFWHCIRNDLPTEMQGILIWSSHIISHKKKIKRNEVILK